ncbi:hypothetical protein D3C81_1793350 [compost metagenome]
MGVDLVQGYLLGRPQELGVRESRPLPALMSVPLAEQPTVRLNATIGQLLELFGRHQHLDALEVVDADGRACGLIHRHALPVPALSPASQLPQVILCT